MAEGVHHRLAIAFALAMVAWPASMALTGKIVGAGRPQQTAEAA
ncbi:hypothetical protein [Granulicoccus phenolivorans]|nr:hypothetical protein [Granulicoccus phenolivorans]